MTQARAANDLRKTAQQNVDTHLTVTITSLLGAGSLQAHPRHSCAPLRLLYFRGTDGACVSPPRQPLFDALRVEAVRAAQYHRALALLHVAQADATLGILRQDGLNQVGRGLGAQQILPSDRFVEPEQELVVLWRELARLQGADLGSCQRARW